VSYPQPGNTSRPREHLLLGAIGFADRSRAGARASLERLAGVVAKELQSDLDDPNPPDAKDRPSAETGELGFVDGYGRGHLNITLGVSATGFDALGVARQQRPADLRRIPWDRLGDTPQNPANGDRILQICSERGRWWPAL
jgi:hypothetical protein